MIAYKCDRCGNYFDGTDYRIMKVTASNGSKDTKFLTDIWLCDDCINGLLDYLNGSVELVEPE